MADERTRSTPSGPEAIRRAVVSILAEVNTSIPGRIEKYDPSQLRANVQPLIRDNNGETLPIVTDVPVIWPTASGGEASVTLPIEKGDECLLVFSKRSIDNWLATGRISNPSSAARFRESDGIAIPGLQSFAGSAEAHPNNVVVRFGKASIQITPGPRHNVLVNVGSGGRLAAGNSTAELMRELVGVVRELSSTLTSIAAITVTDPQSGSPVPINNAASFVSIQARVDALRSKLEQIKGTL